MSSLVGVRGNTCIVMSTGVNDELEDLGEEQWASRFAATVQRCQCVMETASHLQGELIVKRQGQNNNAKALESAEFITGVTNIKVLTCLFVRYSTLSFHRLVCRPSRRVLSGLLEVYPYPSYMNVCPAMNMALERRKLPGDFSLMLCPVVHA